MAITPTCLHIFLCCLVLGRAQWDLENLGERISNQVQQSLRPLQGLGARINGEVQQSVQPLQNLRSRISGGVQGTVQPLQFLGSRISGGVQGSVQPLQFLASRIRGDVRPQFARSSSNGKRYVNRNGRVYECSGTISKSGCSGTLNKLKFDKKEDFCFVSGRSSVNNWYCLSSTGSMSVITINGKTICESGDGSPALWINAWEYEELCKNVALASY